MSTKYILLAAVSIDGKINKNNKHSSNWTSTEDKDHLHKILDQCDLVLVGNRTYQLAKQALALRNCLVFSHATKKSKANCTYINPQKTDIKKFIAQNKYKKIAILGGTAIYDFTMAHNMLDEIYLTIEPIIFGSGLSIFDTFVKKINAFQLVSSKKLNPRGSILLHYKKI